MYTEARLNPPTHTYKCSKAQLQILLKYAYSNYRRKTLFSHLEIVYFSPNSAYYESGVMHINECIPTHIHTYLYTHINVCFCR